MIPSSRIIAVCNLRAIWFYRCTLLPSTEGALCGDMAHELCERLPRAPDGNAQKKDVFNKKALATGIDIRRGDKKTESDQEHEDGHCAADCRDAWEPAPQGDHRGDGQFNNTDGYGRTSNRGHMVQPGHQRTMRNPWLDTFGLRICHF